MARGLNQHRVLRQPLWDKPGVLKAQGITFRRGGGLILLFTAVFGGMGFCYSAFWLALQAPPALALALGAVAAHFGTLSSLDFPAARRHFPVAQ